MNRFDGDPGKKKCLFARVNKIPMLRVHSKYMVDEVVRERIAGLEKMHYPRSLAAVTWLHDGKDQKRLVSRPTWIFANPHSRSGFSIFPPGVRGCMHIYRELFRVM